MFPNSRTGFCAAIVLGLLGVSEETILAEYAFTDKAVDFVDFAARHRAARLGLAGDDPAQRLDPGRLAKHHSHRATGVPAAFDLAAVGIDERGSVLAGFVVSRLAFVVPAWADYAAAPWSVLDLRDGGFLAWPGIVALILGALLYGWRRPALRKPLSAGVITGLVFWGTAITLFFLVFRMGR